MLEKDLKDYEFCKKLPGYPQGNEIEMAFRSLLPFFYTFEYNSSGEKDCLQIKDNMGFIPDKETIKVMAVGLKRFAEQVEQEDIDRYNQKLEESSEVDNSNSSNKTKNNSTEGVVYLLKAKGRNMYKIGCTTNLEKRFDQISPKLPFEIEVEHKIKTKAIYKLEEKLHDKFSDKRLNGEWFELNQEDVEYIKEHGGGYDE